MSENTSLTIGFLFLLVNMFVTISGYVRTRNKDTRAELQNTQERTAEQVRETDAKELANKEFQIKTQMKLDQICTTTSETRTDIKAMESRLSEFDKRLFSTEHTVEGLIQRVQNLETSALSVHTDGKEV